MNFFRSKQNDPLDQAISELRGEQPDAKTLSASAEHVWQKLQVGLGEDAATSALQPIRGCADIRALLPAYILSEASLGLLGLGVAEPLPSWGNMLAELQHPDRIQGNPWVLAPLALLMIVMICLEAIQ